MSIFPETELDGRSEVPVSILQYKDVSDRLGSAAGAPRPPAGAHGGENPAAAKISKLELAATIERERAGAMQETESRLRREFEQKILSERNLIAQTLAAFEEQRNEYFARAEAEVVQLALSIAAKILHRESQVDPMLVAALVRVTIEKMREGSSVTIRVNSVHGNSWRQYFAAIPNMQHVEIVDSASVSPEDCILETELGTTNLGLARQLKEVEQGFFDLLALRQTGR